MRTSLNLIFSVFVMSIMFFGCESKSADKQGTDGKEAITLLSPKDLKSFPADVQLIDVRTPKEYQKSHLKNAININLFSSDFNDKINKLDKNKDVYLYCETGGRSKFVAKRLKKQGFTNIYDLEGGISNWQNYHEIEKSIP